MEVEEATTTKDVNLPLKNYKFRLLSDGQRVTIPRDVVSKMLTLVMMILDIETEDLSKTEIQLIDLVTMPVLQWIIDAHLIYIARGVNAIKKFGDLYKGIELYNQILRVHQPSATPLLASLTGREAALPNKEDILTLFTLVSVLNWFDARDVLLLVEEYVNELVRMMTSDEIRSLLVSNSDDEKSKKRELHTGENELPLTPYYQHEELVILLLSQHLPRELVGSNRAKQKYVNPMVVTKGGTVNYFIKSHGDLYMRGHADHDLLTATDKSIPLKQKNVQLLTSMNGGPVCLTTSGHLFIERVDYVYEKVDVDGEVLLLAGGHTTLFVLTTSGLYGQGGNMYGQLGIGESQDYDVRTWKRIPGIKGYVQAVYSGPRNTLVLTNRGLFGTGKGIRGVFNGSTTFIRVEGFTGQVIDVACAEDHLLIATTNGLYVAGNNSQWQTGAERQFADNAGLTKNTKLPDKAGIAAVYANDSKYSLVLANDSKYSLVLTNDGVLYAIGNNENAKLGTKLTDAMLKEFTPTAMIKGEIRAVVAAYDFVMVLTTEGLFQSSLCKDANTKTRIPVFMKTQIDLGYFTSPTTNKLEPQQKKKLQCVYCGCKAQMAVESAPFCSTPCFLRNQSHS